MPHVLDLLLEDIGKKPFITGVFDILRQLRTFIRTHTAVNAEYEEYRKGFPNSTKLIKPGDTRFATQVIAMENAIVNENTIKATMGSAVVQEYVRKNKNKNPDGKTIEDVYVLLHSAVWDTHREFFRKLESCVLIYRPIASLLRYSEQDQPVMCKMFAAWQHLITYLEGLRDRINADFLDDCVSLCHRRMIYGQSLLQIVGHMLDPTFSEYSHDDQMKTDFQTYIKRQYAESSDIVTHVLQEFNEYINCRGHYSNPDSMKARGTITASEWWECYGSETGISEGKLKEMGMRVCMCVAGAAASERGHKEMAIVHSKVRNKLSPEKVNDLLYVKMNLQFLEQTVQDNFGNEQVFSLDDKEDEEDSNEGEVFGQMDDAWIDNSEQYSCESVPDEVVTLNKKRQTIIANMNSKIGWVPDFLHQEAEAKQTTSGRSSKTPSRFLPEVVSSSSSNVVLGCQKTSNPV